MFAIPLGPVLLLCWIVCSCSPGADPPPARAALAPAVVPSPAAELREQRRPVIDALVSTLRDRYVDLARAEQIISAIEERWQRGAYDSLVEDEAFAAAITADLRASSQDEHLELGVPRPEAAPPAPRRPGNFGFGESQRLSGNVALLPIFGFARQEREPARRALAEALSGVADAAALILDLRENDGGVAPTMAIVLSYLLDGAPLPLMRVERRYDGGSYELWTQAEVEGTRFGASKPLYVLTSARTFSAGEAFAAQLQARKRALLIGETTRGGNGLVERRELGAGFMLTIPVAIAISPLTQQSRKGPVVPDVPLPAEQALEEAHRRALEALARGSSSSG
ncbi:MAG: hypothetical protein RL685_1677 [Pseudomonadota bacterium]|jgi:C-terminal processing protease CtpA/Prc